MKKRIIKYTLIAVLLLPVLFLGVMFCVHHVLRGRECKQLCQNGRYQYYRGSADYSLALTKKGNDNGSHIIIALSGMNLHNYSVGMLPMTELLCDDNLFVEIDRAGYGISNDTHIPQTTEQIVADYRAALRNAGIQPPYVLMPHSLGCVYATYWESLYPEEIEGVFFMDGTAMPQPEAEPASKLLNTLYYAAAQCGLQRLFYDSFFPNLPDNYTDAQRERSHSLNVYHAYSAAQISEAELENENCRTAYEAMVTNDIPKMFINAACAVSTEEQFKEQYEWLRTIWDMPPYESLTQEMIQSELDERRKITEEQILPFVGQLGNCRYVTLPGQHLVYMQRPTDCAVLLTDFLSTLDNGDNPDA